MTLRRCAPLKPSRGEQVPASVRRRVYELDEHRCVCDRAGFPEEVRAACTRNVELDHVRASGALQRKSRSTVDNLVVLSASCHRWKGLNGRVARPLLLDWIVRREDPHAAHVDPVAGCEACYRAVRR